MSVGSSYEPQYVSIDDIPLGDDDWSDAVKRQALRYAESRVEADVNDGDPIENVSPMHEFCVAAFATHLLASGAISPQSTKLGDIADTGGRRDEYADQWWEIYERNMKALVRSRADESTDGGSGGTGSPIDETHGFSVAVIDDESDYPTS